VELRNCYLAWSPLSKKGYQSELKLHFVYKLQILHNLSLGWFKSDKVQLPTIVTVAFAYSLYSPNLIELSMPETAQEVLKMIQDRHRANRSKIRWYARYLATLHVPPQLNWRIPFLLVWLLMVPVFGVGKRLTLRTWRWFQTQPLLGSILLWKCQYDLYDCRTRTGELWSRSSLYCSKAIDYLIASGIGDTVFVAQNQSFFVFDNALWPDWVSRLLLRRLLREMECW